jgi:hypothetical protein
MTRGNVKVGRLRMGLKMLEDLDEPSGGLAVPWLVMNSYTCSDRGRDAEPLCWMGPPRHLDICGNPMASEVRRVSPFPGTGNRRRRLLHSAEYYALQEDRRPQ